MLSLYYFGISRFNQPIQAFLGTLRELQEDRFGRIFDVTILSFQRSDLSNQ